MKKAGKPSPTVAGNPAQGHFFGRPPFFAERSAPPTHFFAVARKAEEEGAPGETLQAKPDRAEPIELGAGPPTPKPPDGDAGSVHQKGGTSSAGSAAERQADAFADRVMGLALAAPVPPDSPKPPSGPAIAARAESASVSPGPGLASRLQSRKGQGSPLPASTRERLEEASGRDLSDVRLHTDQNAHELSRELNAKAFAYGSDIFFKRGQYQPATRGGQHLLAHEVGHVASGHTGVQRNIDDYDVVPLGNFDNVWELARHHGLDPREVMALNEKAYREEYARTFNPRRMFPSSRVFLPKGTIAFHSNEKALEVELRKVRRGRKHFDDPLYPGTLREYELRYYVREHDHPVTDVTSFDLAVSQKLDILLDKGTQFTLKISASTGLDSFNVERERMTRKQLEEKWLQKSTLTGGLSIEITSETFNTDFVDLTHYQTTVNAFAPGSMGKSIVQEHAEAGAAFANLDSSLEEKYRAALQLVRRQIERSSYTMVDFNQQLDGNVHYTQRAADEELLKLRDFPGDGVVSETRDGRFRVVPLTQADMSFIARHQRGSGLGDAIHHFHTARKLRPEFIEVFDDGDGSRSCTRGPGGSTKGYRTPSHPETPTRTSPPDTRRGPDPAQALPRRAQKPRGLLECSLRDRPQPEQKAAPASTDAPQ